MMSIHFSQSLGMQMFLVPRGTLVLTLHNVSYEIFQPLQLSIDLSHFALHKNLHKCVFTLVQILSYFYFSVLITRWLRQHPRVLSMAFKKVNKISIKIIIVSSTYSTHSISTVCLENAGSIHRMHKWRLNDYSFI